MNADARPASDQLGALRRALGGRTRFPRDGGSAIVAPLRGGGAALLGRSATRRLITTVTADDVRDPSSGVVGWLERMQARRSALLVVPDRPSGVAVALRWGISPERFRLASSFEAEGRQTDLLATAKRRPWYSRG